MFIIACHPCLLLPVIHNYYSPSSIIIIAFGLIFNNGIT